jgi:hypothetical protein
LVLETTGTKLILSDGADDAFHIHGDVHLELPGLLAEGEAKGDCEKEEEKETPVEIHG